LDCLDYALGHAHLFGAGHLVRETKADARASYRELFERKNKLERRYNHIMKDLFPKVNNCVVVSGGGPRVSGRGRRL
jgi:hypothetical protein